MSSGGEAQVDTDVVRVLIVDDNPPTAQTTGWMVEMMGFDYSLAHAPDDAMARAEAYAPHIILLDIGLPGMNGYDLCKILRQQPAREKTVFIALTGWGQDEHRRRASAAGFDHFLVKPVQFETLETLLKDAAAGL